MRNDFNMEHEGDMDFAYGFRAAHDAYKALPLWHRLLGLPFGSAFIDTKNKRGYVQWRAEV